MKKFAYIGCLGFIGVITTEFGVIGILPQIAKHYLITIDVAGYLLSAFALIIALTGPLMTLLMSGYDKRKMMLLALSIFVLTGLISSLSPPFWLLMLVRILPAFLQPVYIATALSVAIANADKKHENELMGIVFSGVAIAMVTTVPFATYLSSIATWEVSFMVQTAVSIIAWLAIYFVLPPLPVTEKKSYGSQIQILKKPIFLVSTAMNFFMITAWFSTYSYFADYLNKAKNMDNTTMSLMMLLFGVVGVFAMRVAGKMLNKNIAKTTAFFLSGTIIVPILLYAASDHFWAVTAVIVIWGFLYAPSFLNASSYMISSATGNLEFANSLATSFGNLGVFLGTTLGGWMIVARGVAYTPWISMLFGTLALLMMMLRYMLEKKHHAPSFQYCKTKLWRLIYSKSKQF